MRLLSSTEDCPGMSLPVPRAAPGQGDVPTHDLTCKSSLLSAFEGQSPNRADLLGCTIFKIISDYYLELPDSLLCFDPLQLARHVGRWVPQIVPTISAEGSSVYPKTSDT